MRARKEGRRELPVILVKPGGKRGLRSHPTNHVPRVKMQTGPDSEFMEPWRHQSHEEPGRCEAVK